MPRTPSDFNSRGPKPGAKPGSRSGAPRAGEGGKFGGAKGFGRAPREDDRDAAPRGAAKPAPRRDTMPVFDAEPERPFRAAKPASKEFGAKAEGKSFGAKSFGTKAPAGRGFGADEGERSARPARSFGAKPEGKSFGSKAYGAKAPADRGFGADEGERPARPARSFGAKPEGKSFGAKAPAGRSFGPRDGDDKFARPGAAKPYGKPGGPRGRPARDEGASPISMPVKDASAPERIAKAMSRGGVASRRDAEKMILEGRVTVNGKVIDSPALTVTAKDKITIDGHVLAAPEAPRLWLYHKPEGLVTTARDELGRPTVFDDLPEDMPRVMSVGRLDLTSEGLLLLTNDGEVKRKLELPSTGWLRKYRVRVNGRPVDPDFEPLRQGIVIDGEVFAPMIVGLDRQQGANAWLTVAIREGRNREIRRGMEAVGYQVNRLIRVSYGPFQLGDLKPGEVAEVRPKLLRDQLGMTESEEDEGFRATDRGTRSISRTITRGKPGTEGAKRGPAKGARGAAPRDEVFPGERSPYAPRSASAERGERPNYAKPKPGEDRAFGKPERAGQGERPTSYGKPSGERGFGAKPKASDERAPRAFGKPERAGQGERASSFGKPAGERGFGAKPAGKGFAAAPAAGKPALTRGGARVTEVEAPKPAWARGAASGKPAGGKPFGGKPANGKPAGGKPFGGKPSGGARKR